MHSLPVALTIAGSDSGGGAGIQADLKTFTMLGCFGTSVLTALTAQNSTSVTAIEAPSPGFVADQLDAVLSDMEVRAAKTGMLYSAAIIEALAEGLADKAPPLVVDPVCVSQSGAKLLQDEAVQAMVELIFPLADLLTPNIPEAELFTGLAIKDSDSVAEAGTRLLAMGPSAVLIKGGHMDSVTSTDWLFVPDQKPLPLIQRRIDTVNLHGTGCTLSAAIAAGLARGLELHKAVRQAQHYLQLGLLASYAPGKGPGPVNHAAPFLALAARDGVRRELAQALPALHAMAGLGRLAPRGPMHLALAAAYALEPQDVAAFEGGLRFTGRTRLVQPGCPEFGASPEASALLLAVRRFQPDIHCTVNLRTGEDVQRALEESGVVAAWFDRDDMDPAHSASEQGVIGWGAAHALRSLTDPGEVRAILDWGAGGVEPQARIFAPDLPELMDMLTRLLRVLS